MSTGSNARLVVDLEALTSNYACLQRVTGARVGAVVKADAYGLGLPAVSGALRRSGCELYFTALASEGAALRSILPDVDIFVFSPLIKKDIELLLANDLLPCLYAFDEIRQFITRSKAAGKNPRAALHVETGINRLGLDREGLDAFRSDGLGGELQIELLMSHLACADEPDSPLNRRQLERFVAIKNLFPGVPASLANSAGTFLGTDYHFDVVRPGIALFGHDPHSPIRTPRVEPVATLKAFLGQVKTVPAGESVGYGATASCDAATRVGTVLAGYADGIPRNLADNHDGRMSMVSIAGRRVPLFGRVSMDLTTVDLSGLGADEPRPGEAVEFFGRNLPIEEIASAAGTIPYELLTRTGARVTRSYES